MTKDALIFKEKEEMCLFAAPQQLPATYLWIHQGSHRFSLHFVIDGPCDPAHVASNPLALVLKQTAFKKIKLQRYLSEII